MTPTLVFVGGFLGAGKTTLLLKAAQLLQSQGRRVALIMNDQDSELVDTKHSRAKHLQTAEVSGGCFCCRFSDLLDQAKGLLAYNPSVIFAEPVGSCIDLSATILQPFKMLHGDLFKLAPLTVLIDPGMAHDGANAYLIRQQIREADILCTTKADLYPRSVDLPYPTDFRTSAVTGQGVEEWLTEVLSGNRIAGSRILDVDYDEYAEAEAALGWVNVQAELVMHNPASPALLVGPLLESLDAELTRANIQIAHLKLFDQTPGAYLVATIRTNGQEAVPVGDLMAEPAPRHELSINLRALGDADASLDVVRRVLSRLPAAVIIRHVRAFQPMRPTPEHRYTAV
jgi:hypothetical protein